MKVEAVWNQDERAVMRNNETQVPMVMFYRGVIKNLHLLVALNEGPYPGIS